MDKRLFPVLNVVNGSCHTADIVDSDYQVLNSWKLNRMKRLSNGNEEEDRNGPRLWPVS